MKEKTKFRISLGAIAGSILLGGATYQAMTLVKESKVIPFYKEITDEYKVNTKIISINITDEDEKIITETEDKMYLTKEQLEKIDFVEIDATSRTVTQDESNDIECIKNDYQYGFDFDTLTSEEIEEKIKLLKAGNIEKISEGASWSTSNTTNPIIIPEHKTSLEIKINTVDYNDVKRTTQTSKEDLQESFLLTMLTLLGGGLGYSIEQNLKLEREMYLEQKKVKSKRLKK